MAHHPESKGQPLLLLLPSPPTALSLPAFRAAYEPAIANMLVKVAEGAESRSRQALDIVVDCAGQLSPSQTDSGSNSYAYLQHLLALLYRLVCYICAKKNVEPERAGAVDIRVLLIGSGDDGDDNDTARREVLTQGPVFSLPELAGCSRRWSIVYSPECESAEGLVRRFVNLRRSSSDAHARFFQVGRLPGGTCMRVQDEDHGNHGKIASGHSQRSHRVVAVGGTFDHLHEGHKLLLSATALALEGPRASDPSSTRRLIVGITGDELLVNKKYAESMESWDDRQGSVFAFLCAIVMATDGSNDAVEHIERRADKGPNGVAIHYKLRNGLVIECVKISDPFGPTITDESVSALVVSGETRSGGKAVNDKRREKGWSALEMFEVDVLDADAEQEGPVTSTDRFQGKVSSTEIRRRLQERRHRS